MQLKKVELSGFKSFASKTELEIPAGITTIVGPNGSGKSNILEAVRWVLGEQSAKSLRGGKMEDVIFSGTQSRKMAGYAEVTLTLSNTSKKLPVDFEEVAVTRRLYRSGESQYYINQSSCRLKDIQELFMDTGIGKDGYSIISQGKIEEVLSNKAEDRRGIFEEAAGIVKYKKRKHEAENKLLSAEDNISRISDILNEISTKIEPLSEQAKVARRYLEIKEKLKYADASIFLDRINEITVKLEQYGELLNSATASVLEEEEKIGSSFDRKQSLKESVEVTLAKIELMQEEYYNLKDEFGETKSKIEADLGKIDGNNEKIEDLKEEICQNLSDIDNAKQDIDNRTIKIERLKQNKVVFEKQLEEKEVEYLDISSNMNEYEKNIEALKENIIDINESNAIKQNEIKTANIEIENCEKRKDNLENSIKTKITEIDTLNIEIEEYHKEVDKEIRECISVEKLLEEFKEDLERTSVELEEIKQKRNEKNAEIQKITHEREILIAMENQNEGYTRSVKSVLEYAKEDKKVYGTVAKIFQTSEKYEVAIEAILGGLMQNIVVENEDTAKKYINYLKENKLGKATFLPLTTIRVKPREVEKKAKTVNGYIGEALKLVEYDSKFSKVMQLALSNIVVVDNIDNAVKLAKEINYTSKIVTLDGEIITQVGSMSGGSNSVKTSGIVGRSKKIEILKEKIENLKVELEKIESVENAKERLDNKTSEYNKLNEKYIDLKTKKAAYEEKEKSYNFKLLTIKENRQKIEKEIELSLVKKEETRNKIITITEEIEESKKVLEEKQIAVDDYARFNKEKSERMDELNAEITDLKISLSSFDESKDSLDEMIKIFEDNITNFQDIIARKNEEVENLKLENEKILNAKSNLSTITSDYESKIEEKSQKIALLKVEKEEKNKEIEKIEFQYKDAYKAKEAMQEEKMRLENLIEKQNAEMESLKNRMWDEYEMTTSKAKEILEVSEEQVLLVKAENPDLRKFAQKLKVEIKNMGPINVAAIEEYAEVKERYEFLTTQKNDIEITKTRLLELIDNMTSIMKKQFKSQFELINENFNNVFTHLFGGGKARLILTDESNILESGIDIEAQPTGKKLQHLSLLSGGERALTAIALLFAILQMKTPPFCILDEIEAALDDVNVQRFAKYIKKYSDKTQFIVITHRKGTMEVAKTVYGVTMQEHGISNAVSIKMK